MVCLVIPATMVDLGSVYIKDFQEKLVDQDPQVRISKAFYKGEWTKEKGTI